VSLNEARIFHNLTRCFGTEPQNVAVAVSGGADSMALLYCILVAAQTHTVHAIIVDHALRPESAREAELTAQRVRDMGAVPIVMRWQHDGVNTAVQEKAREARYALFAQACTEIGTDEIFVGHTEDDQAETVGMRREAGSGPRGLAGIAPRVTAPLWPQTRNLTIIRPLLSSSRADIRAFCRTTGIPYVDDPSNEDPKYTRVAMRARIAKDPALRAELLSLSADMAKIRDAEDSAVRAWFGLHVSRIENAGVRVPADCLSTMPPGALADMLRLASGQARRVDPAKAQALQDHISAPDFKPRTLGGAIVYAAGENIAIARAPGVLLGRRGERPVRTALRPRETHVWDGRFELSTDRQGITVGAVWPGRAQLNDAARKALKGYDMHMRKTLPAFYRGDEVVAVPAAGFQIGTGNYTARDIMRDRFH